MCYSTEISSIQNTDGEKKLIQVSAQTVIVRRIIFLKTYTFLVFIRRLIVHVLTVCVPLNLFTCHIHIHTVRATCQAHSHGALIRRLWWLSKG